MGVPLWGYSCGYTPMVTQNDGTYRGVLFRGHLGEGIDIWGHNWGVNNYRLPILA